MLKPHPQVLRPRLRPGIKATLTAVVALMLAAGMAEVVGYCVQMADRDTYMETFSRYNTTCILKLDEPTPD